MSGVGQRMDKAELLARLRAARELNTRISGEMRVSAEELQAQLVDMANDLAAARKQIVNLEIALQTSRHIGVAIGILMARRAVTEEEAFGLLVSVSQRSHRKLRDIAEQVVYTGELPHVA
jgi:AmiR/NasT family two-component response regulator